MEIDNVDGECLYLEWLRLMIKLTYVYLILLDNYIDNVGFEVLLNNLNEMVNNMTGACS